MGWEGNWFVQREGSMGFVSERRRRAAVLPAVALLVLFPAVCFSQSSELEALKEWAKKTEAELQKALQRIDQLEKEKTSTSARVDNVEKSVQAVQSAPSSFNPAIGLVLDAVAEQRSQAGGNFNFRAAELGL